MCLSRIMVNTIILYFSLQGLNEILSYSSKTGKYDPRMKTLDKLIAESGSYS